MFGIEVGLGVTGITNWRVGTALIVAGGLTWLVAGILVGESYLRKRPTQERMRTYEQVITSGQESPTEVALLQELIAINKAQLVVSTAISTAGQWTQSRDKERLPQLSLVSRARISAAGAILDDSENVSSIGDLGIGRRAIVWTRAYADSEYDVYLTAYAKGCRAEIEGKSVDSVSIRILNYDNVPKDAVVGVYAVGTG